MMRLEIDGPVDANVDLCRADTAGWRAAVCNVYKWMWDSGKVFGVSR